MCCQASPVLGCSHLAHAAHRSNCTVFVQAMWANLSSLVQQLLHETVMEAEDALSASLAMAGTLADAASTLMQANSPAVTNTTTSSGSGSGAADRPGGGGGTGAAVMLLECSAQLLDHAKRQAAVLTQPLEEQEQLDADAPSLVRQVADIQQQVRLGPHGCACCNSAAQCSGRGRHGTSARAVATASSGIPGHCRHPMLVHLPTAACDLCHLLLCWLPRSSCSWRKHTWPPANLGASWSV